MHLAPAERDVQTNSRFSILFWGRELNFECITMYSNHHKRRNYSMVESFDVFGILQTHGALGAR